MTTGDLVFVEGRGLIPWLVATTGRSRYSHVGMIVGVRVGQRPTRYYLAEFRGFWGGRLLPIRRAAKLYGSRAFVYIVRRSVSTRERAADNMMRMVGRRYDWKGILRLALTRALVVRWFVRPWRRSDNGDRQLFCSEAVSRAYRLAGVDLVPELPDEATEPGDLARSALVYPDHPLYDRVDADEEVPP